jgi:hypothetical protein
MQQRQPGCSPRPARPPPLQVLSVQVRRLKSVFNFTHTISSLTSDGSDTTVCHQDTAIIRLLKSGLGRLRPELLGFRKLIERLWVCCQSCAAAQHSMTLRKCGSRRLRTRRAVCYSREG